MVSTGRIYAVVQPSGKNLIEVEQISIGGTGGTGLIEVAISENGLTSPTGFSLLGGGSPVSTPTGSSRRNRTGGTQVTPPQPVVNDPIVNDPIVNDPVIDDPVLPPAGVGDDPLPIPATFDTFESFQSYYGQPDGTVTGASFNNYIADNVLGPYGVANPADSNYFDSNITFDPEQADFDLTMDSINDYYSSYGDYATMFDQYGGLTGEAFTDFIHDKLSAAYPEFYNEAHNDYVNDGFQGGENYEDYLLLADDINRYYFADNRDFSNPNEDIYVYYLGHHDYNEFGDYLGVYEDLSTAQMAKFIHDAYKGSSSYHDEDNAYIAEQLLGEGESYFDYLEFMMEVDGYKEFLNSVTDEGDVASVLANYIDQWYNKAYYGNTPFSIGMFLDAETYADYIDWATEIDDYYAGISYNGNPMALLQPADAGGDVQSAPEPGTVAMLCVLGIAGVFARRRR